MGTGVNAQLRLKALHHLDVPWLPSRIEQREGRIVRQGNQHDVVDIFACVTQGLLDASMWQDNERKAHFIAAALSGDTSIRRLDDLGKGAANQVAPAKATASGDERLMQKAGLEADYTTVLQRTGADYDIDLAGTVTPLGAISRLEHALDGFHEERDRYRLCRRTGRKRQKLGEVEEALTKSACDDTEPDGSRLNPPRRAPLDQIGSASVAIFNR